MLRNNLEGVKRRIESSCRRANRDPSTVTLVCVTKTVPAAVIQEAMALGVTDIGESRIQEARDKHEVLGRQASALRWHLIGHLQRNKAKPAVKLFDVIHSADDNELIDELQRQAALQDKKLAVFLQVNVSGESTKSGCRPEEVAALADKLRLCAHLTFAGLMTIPPAGVPEQARPYFRKLRLLRDEVQKSLAGQEALKLSMGMSHDFEAAIEEGADFIRVGTAIFGERPE